jgi:hypothetical protein
MNKMDKDLLYKILYDMNSSISKWKFDVDINDEIISDFYCEIYTLWKRKEMWERGELITVTDGLGRINLKSYPKNMMTSAKQICQLFRIPYYY